MAKRYIGLRKTGQFVGWGDDRNPNKLCPYNVGVRKLTQTFLDALNDQLHPEHEEYSAWIGGDFDPAAYDINEVNELLSEYCR